MKQILIIAATFLILSAQSLAQELWIPSLYPYYYTRPVVRWTPVHSRRITPQDAEIYRIIPYGGTNYRTNWTNYRPQDTSWGYRQGRPRAKDLGIKHQKLNHPNPRSLYRK